MLRNLSILAVLLFLCISSNTAHASHFLGYDMELVNIKDANNNQTDTYKWRMRFYRDVSGIPIPTSFSFSIYKVSDNAIAGNFTVSKINPQTFINYSPELCAPLASQNKIELGIYESPVLNYAALNHSAGYYASVNHCCRNTGIVNVQGESSAYGGLLYVSIPRLSPGVITRYNSSPQFNSLPMYGFTVGNQYNIDWSASDPDGDSLVYSIVKPLDGGPTKPSFIDIPYPTGYSLIDNIADGNPDVTIDSLTGMISYKPTIANRYLLAVKVEEYRKIAGIPIKIGEVRRELQIEAMLNTELPPVLYDSLPNSSVYDTIDVPNSSSTQTKILNFISIDQANDSVYIQIIPEISISSNNILDTNLIDVAWADILGNTKVGADAQNFIIRGLANARAFLIIKADSNNASTVPFKFKIVSYDNSCFVPLTDTVHYELLIRGEQCYSSVQSVITACDSFVTNGITYYQSVTLTDTVKASVGCDVITITDVNISPTPIANFNNLNIYVTDTALSYTYKVDTQSNVTYQWYVSANGSILSGANINEILVKWNVDNSMEEIYCFVFNGSCFDSLYSPIVVSHIVGINNFAVNKITVYPNPVSDVLKFNLSTKLENASINIYNTLGQLVLKDILTQNELNVSELPQGIYNFNIVKDGRNYRGKFVKQ
jgi:Secretion system C-terminal sorting domain